MMCRSRVTLANLAVILLVLQATACSSNFRKGLQSLEAHNSPEALYYFEQDAEKGYRIPAILASSLYIGDLKIPQDLEKSKYYLERALEAEYAQYDQAYDYFIPVIKAHQILEDGEQRDKSLAFQMLNYERYQEYTYALLLQAEWYLITQESEAEFKKGKEYFEQAMEHQVWDSSGIAFSWFLSVYPHKDFSNPELSLSYAQEAMDDDDLADQPIPQSILANAYAVNGNYSMAAEVQASALKALNEQIQLYPYLDRYLEAFERRLQLYESGMPWTLTLEDIKSCASLSLYCVPN